MKLRFLRPIFHKSENVAVFLGDKRDDSRPGDIVILKQVDNDVAVAKGRLINIEYKPFKNITVGELMEEHDPACRSIEGLAFELLCIYQHNFCLESWVSVVTFTIE